MSEIEKAIDFCKGQIKSLKKAKKKVPFEKFDKNKCDNITRKIHRYKTILEVLEKANKELI